MLLESDSGGKDVNVRSMAVATFPGQEFNRIFFVPGRVP